jgi:N-hydroxyarylamine O-acetyltransferase
VVADGWCFQHDPAGSFSQMDFMMRPAVPQDFAVMHSFLSTDPESIFVRTATAQRRHRNGVSILRGCMFTTIDANGKHRQEVTRKDSWLGLLRREFQLPLTGMGPAEREKLWQRVYSSHRQWCLEAGGPTSL